MKKIKLRGIVGKGKFALVDDEDYNKFNKYSYHLSVYATRCILKRIGGKNKKIRLHREIMNAKDDQMIDHINGNKLDNRKCNLRFCNPSQNNANRKKQSFNKIGLKGVSYTTDNNSNKYRARIGYRGKDVWIGTFDNSIDASNAYDKKAIELYGEFAKLNKAVEICKEQK